MNLEGPLFVQNLFCCDFRSNMNNNPVTDIQAFITFDKLIIQKNQSNLPHCQGIAPTTLF